MLVGFSYTEHEVQNRQNPSKSGIKLFLTFGLELDLRQMTKYSLVRGESSYRWPMGSSSGDSVQSARISVLHVTVSCSGLYFSANFQWLISFWPHNGSNGAKDKDKHGSLPGAKAEIFLVIAT